MPRWALNAADQTLRDHEAVALCDAVLRAANEAFYQARGWHPFQGEVYAEQPGGRIRFESDGAICVRFHPQAARRNNRPYAACRGDPARCAGGLRWRRRINVSHNLLDFG
jgi:hypothetical protein